LREGERQKMGMGRREWRRVILTTGMLSTIDLFIKVACFAKRELI